MFKHFLVALSLGHAVYGKLDILNPDELVGIKGLAIVPLRRYIGAQEYNTTIRLKYFSPDMASKVCFKEFSESQRAELQLNYNNTAIIFDDDFKVDCLGDDPRHISYEYIKTWCSISKLLIYVNPKVPGLFYNSHDGTRFSSFKNKYRDELYKCTVLQMREDEAMLRVMKFIQENNETYVNASIRTEPSECASVFDSIPVQFGMRVVLGGFYLVTAFSSLMNLVSLKSAGAKKENRQVATMALCVNFLTMAVLGFILAGGGWRVTADISEAANNFVVPQFFGSTTAIDYLIAYRWSEIKRCTQNKFRSQFKGRDAGASIRSLRCWKKLTLVVATAMITVDWAAAILTINVTDETEPMINLYLPLVFIVMQLLVAGYLVVQVFGMVSLLKGLQMVDPGKEISPAEKSLQDSHRALIKRLRFWILCSVAAGMVTLMFLILIGTTNLLLDTCEGWVLIWSGTLIAKLFNVWGQNNICVPKNRDPKIETATNDIFPIPPPLNNAK